MGNYTIYRDGCSFYTYAPGFDGVRIKWAEVNAYRQACVMLKGLDSK